MEKEEERKRQARLAKARIQASLLDKDIMQGYGDDDLDMMPEFENPTSNVAVVTVVPPLVTTAPPTATTTK